MILAKPYVYIELNRHARRILKWRMRDGSIPPADLWGDVRTFHPKLRGLRVQLVCGGFPCQAVSALGKRDGLKRQSFLFYEMVRVAVEAQAEFIFLENVFNLLSCGMKEVLRELTSKGFACRWVVCAAQQFGLPHVRKRVFLLGKRGAPFKVRLPAGSIPSAGFLGRPEGNRVCGKIQTEVGCTLPRCILRKPLVLKYRRKIVKKKLYPTPRSGGGNYALKTGLRGRNQQDLGSVLKYSQKNPKDRRSWKKRHVHVSFMEWLMGFPIGWTRKRLQPGSPPKKLVVGHPLNTRRRELVGNACCPKQCKWAFHHLLGLFQAKPVDSP